MRILIKHKGSEFELENNYQYSNHVDLRNFVLDVIVKAINKMNEI